MRIVTLACAGIALLVLCVPASALSITPLNDETSASLQAFVAAMVGAGITVDTSSIVYVGATPADNVHVAQSAIYTGFNTVGNGAHTNGILMTSGLAAIPLTNTASNYSHVIPNVLNPGTGSDDDLRAIVGQASVFDTNSLEFTFTVAAGVTSVEFDFVYGTEEFPEFKDSADPADYIDVFAVFVDGTNRAFLGGNPVILTTGTEAFFNNNDFGASTYNLEYDAFTNSIHVVATIDENLATHTIKIAIADGSDVLYDSGAFIGNLRASGDPGPGNPDVPEPASIALLGLGLAGLGLMARKRRRTA